jgi:5-methylcytosine-specific restriction endonuclease McrA
MSDKVVPLRQPEHVALMRAEPHQWGLGHVHEIDLGNDKTLCGRTPANTPGAKFWGPRAQVTCKGCQRSQESRQRHDEWQAKFDRDEAERKARRAAYHVEWWQAYEEYLLTPEWQRRRQLVMRRCNMICEGCGMRRAVQVHHLRYPQYCLPGSVRWLETEKLWDLQAACRECHEDVHRYR